jgi:hypothetical protein
LQEGISQESSPQEVVGMGASSWEAATEVGSCTCTTSTSSSSIYSSQRPHSRHVSDTGYSEADSELIPTETKMETDEMLGAQV